MNNSRGDCKFKKICVFCGSNPNYRKIFSDAAIDLENEMVNRKINLVYGGGSVGLMGLLSQRVYDGGCHVLGLIPKALVPIEMSEESVGEVKIVSDMHERKAEMAREAEAFIALPGGYGTMEELMEMITWAQLGIHGKPVGLLNVDGYYDPLLTLFDKGVEEGFIKPSARQIVLSAPTAKELLTKMEFWEERWKSLYGQKKNHLIRHNVIPGDIVAIASTIVTEHNGRLQLESKYLTTVEINPDMPQTIEHVTRLRELPAVQPTEAQDKIVTLLDLRLSSQQKIQTPRNFICEAKITQIHEDRGWYYVLCSKCSNKMYPEQDTDRLIFICKDDDNITPNFRYCINTTITDETGIADAVFFNDNMQEMLNMSCMEMFTKHADTTNPKIVPQQLKSAVGRLVNNVSNITSASGTQTTAGTSTFTPTTPLLKAGTSKGPLPETPELTKN
ncbi:hypothetical protein CASFOL_037938 [Castilleja foliolosa]|uniref:cytokinin riboside 5'-monophosphate phosphoribohydrolase n=1 Tax=Castilleja foliolosa TaxID=1961234 RepID=A0ABD3BK16_9LAMI